MGMQLLLGELYAIPVCILLVALAETEGIGAEKATIEAHMALEIATDQERAITAMEGKGRA